MKPVYIALILSIIFGCKSKNKSIDDKELLPPKINYNEDYIDEVAKDFNLKDSCDLSSFVSIVQSNKENVKTDWNINRIFLLNFINQCNKTGEDISISILKRNKNGALDSLRVLIDDAMYLRDRMTYGDVPSDNFRLNKLIFKYYCYSIKNYEEMWHFMNESDPLTIDKMKTFFITFAPDDDKKMLEINKEFKSIQKKYNIVL